MITEFDKKTIQYSNSISDLGVMEGKMGACLYFYIAGKIQQKKYFTKQGELLLDEIFKSVSLSTPTNFGNGLSGIGWGLECLIQNNQVKGNSDKILEDIDNSILKTLSTDFDLDIDFNDGLTGYMLYVIQRLNSKRKSEKSLAFKLNCELLIYILNSIDQKYLSSAHPITDDIQFDFFQNYPYLVKLLGFAFDLNLFNTKIRRMANELFRYFETSTHALNTNRLHLVLEIMILTNKLQSNKWNRLIDNLLYSICFENLIREIDATNLGFRSGLAGLKYCLTKVTHILPADSIYQMEARQALKSLPEILIESPSEAKDIPIEKFSLSNGLIGSMLFEMHNTSSSREKVRIIQPLLF